MSSDHCPPDSRRERSFRERRASIACTHCRRLKKRCKPGGGAGCQRCDATGRECQYTRVRDDSSSSQVLDSPSPAVEPVILEHEGSDIASPFPGDEISMEQLSLYLDLFGASNTNPQPPTFQSPPYSQTPETPYFSNIIHDTDSNRYAHFDIANFELFIPNTPANPSVPRSAYNPSITYNQDIDASSYILPCFFCSAGHHCVVHTPESHYL